MCVCERRKTYIQKWKLALWAAPHGEKDSALHVAPTIFSTQQLSADGIIAGMENGNLTDNTASAITNTHTHARAHIQVLTYADVC
jgi:hypothetical protein